ncbi:MAG TPA: class F sortase [Acidimicrobiia bacterium]|nr:class F sortase [Acidimicrobiia bacterium]
MIATRGMVAVLVAAAVAVSGCAAHTRASRAGTAQPVFVAAATTLSTPDPWAVKARLPVYHPRRVVLHQAVPARVQIPSIGVDVPLVPLGLAPDDTMEVPHDFTVAGWYTNGPRPGETGPAVIAGHVDSYTGPAVFFRLKDLQPGSEVRVARVDGSSATFVVTRVAHYGKDAFPTSEVFGPAPAPELRLITCGGDFDFARRSYRDNVVVFAELVAKH